MTTKVVPLDKFSKELGDLSRGQIKQFKAGVIDALAMNLKTLVERSPVDTGLYAQSWALTVTEKSALIGNTAPHAGIIEFGARPFVPPIGPLLEWARRVLKRPEIDDQCWALAKGTQMKIAEEGMEPKHVLGGALDKIVEDIRIRVKEHLNGRA